MGVGGQCPGRWERDPVPTYRRLGGPQGWSGRVQKILLPPEFEPWTVHPVASRYIDCTLSAHDL